MNNLQDIANRIKLTAKAKKISIKDMLSDCGLGINTISHLSKGQAISFVSLTQIADYLGCGVDYLLGREEYIGGEHDQGIKLYLSLDETDRAEIRGEMRCMLKSKKYSDDKRES